MIPTCPVCSKEMELRLRGEVMSTDLFDDAAALLYRCHLMMHSASLVLVQTERRGSFDNETVDALTIPIAEHTLRRLSELGDACPNRNDHACACAWHKECSAASIVANRTALTLGPDELFSDEDEREKNIYYYGVTA